MILQRYIGLNLLKGWLLVLLILGAVFGLISFIEELGHTSGDYSALSAALYTLRTLPSQLLDLAPVIALLGSIVSLANLGRFNELTIISNTGFPPGKLLLSIALPTVPLMVGLWLCMEYITPPLQQSAEQDRHRQRVGEWSQLPSDGVWSVNGNRYLHIGRMLDGNQLSAVSLFEFDDSGALIRALKAKNAEVSDDRHWIFQKVREKKLSDGQITTLHYKELEIPELWASNELPTLALPDTSMALSVLYSYSEYLDGNGQPPEKYLNTFWQKLLMPVTVFAMVLLATTVSASVTAGRDRSFGMNIGIGAILGIVFYLGTQIIFSVGQLLQWNIPIVASLPALVILLCALFLFKRMRW